MRGDLASRRRAGLPRARDRGARARRWPRRTRPSSPRPAASCSAEENRAAARAGRRLHGPAPRRSRVLVGRVAAARTIGRCSTTTRSPRCAACTAERETALPRGGRRHRRGGRGRRRGDRRSRSLRRARRRGSGSDPRPGPAARPGLRRVGRRRGRAVGWPTCCPPGARRVAVVTQAGMPDLRRPWTAPVVRCEIGDGERHKTLATVEDLCRAFARGGLTRADCVVAVGGGLVTDVAGSPPRRYHRGIAVVHVPTTLLGMVDAAIGGKTGVNLPEGKNLVGAFWQPAGGALRHRRAGHAARARVPQRARARWPSTTSSPATTCSPCRLDERVAARASPSRPTSWRPTSARPRPAPARPGGPSSTTATPSPTRWRSTGDHDLRHGEAVGHRPGLRRRAGRALGRIDAGPRRRAPRASSAAYDSTPRCRPGSTTTSCVALMGRDKKAIDGLTFVLDGPAGRRGGGRRRAGAVEAALARMGA